LFNLDPPATDEEIRASAVQFVRKLSGSSKPSSVNEAAFDRAVASIVEASKELLHGLRTTAAPRNRELEAVKARARAGRRHAQRGAL